MKANKAGSTVVQDEPAEPVFVDGEAEEVVLGQKELEEAIKKVKELRNGSFYKITLLEHPVLPKAQILELSRRYRDDGDESAREKIILHNLLLAMHIAKDYIGHG